MPAIYNHAFDIAFTLLSAHPRGDDVTAEMIRAALVERLRALSDEELIEAVGRPFDTYAENIGEEIAAATPTEI